MSKIGSTTPNMWLRGEKQCALRIRTYSYDPASLLLAGLHHRNLLCRVPRANHPLQGAHVRNLLVRIGGFEGREEEVGKGLLVVVGCGYHGCSHSFVRCCHFGSTMKWRFASSTRSETPSRGSP